MAQEKIQVPDIGDFKNIPIIEIHIKTGDLIEKDAPLVTLESDKTTMEIPSPFKGKVLEVYMKDGDRVSKGSDLILLEIEGENKKIEVPKESQKEPPVKSLVSEKRDSASAPAASQSRSFASSLSESVYASPYIRKLAREFGVNLSNVRGSGERGRIREEDIKSYVKGILEGGVSLSSQTVFPKLPEIDFSQFGETEKISLTRIQKISSTHLHACWVNIPHVTQFDTADITELEAFRKDQTSLAKEKGVKLTPVAFLLKAISYALKEFPRFNASLASNGTDLILKKYISIF